MALTVRDLIAQLEAYPEDTEVRFASQPSWPFEYSIGDVVSSREAAADAECDEHGHYNCADCADSEPEVLYLAEGQQLGYLSAAVANAAWR